MQVKVYAVDQDTGEETQQGEAGWLEDVLQVEKSDEQYGEALDYLTRDGRYYVGGGAAQLFRLVRITA